MTRRASMLMGMVLLCVSPTLAQDGSLFQDDFDAGDARWQPYFDAGKWSVSDGVYRSTSPFENSARLAKTAPIADVLVEAEVRVAAAGRANFGLVLRAQDDRSCAVVRYYDRSDKLELLRYAKGAVTQVPGQGEALKLKRGEWYRIKAAVADNVVLAKLWPSAQAEPSWQLQATTPDRRAGGVGLIAQDESDVEFRNFQVRSGPDVAAMKQGLAAARKDAEKRIRELLALEIEATPLVLRTAQGPMRQILARTVAEGKPESVAGKLSIAFGQTQREYTIKTTDLVNGAYPISLPEPAEPVEVRASFEASFGKQLEATCTVKPARKWTFYMTPHTHYDIGFTHPQQVVIERLSADMDAAVKYCEETADWPAESRYRWTVEVSGLMKNYIDRHTPEQVAKLMEFVRQGRIEICGYYLNMPTELTGHEETIRCLYYAQELRRKYGVTIDTAMINDVPGYAWALPELFTEAGITKVAFRANSIRGRFLWYRPGAVPRPFYWQGPAGDRIFVWYTDSYREGNFFRPPGLFENEFASIIRRNEQAGCWVDDIQLRMGGDNLPPELNTSKNARAWNEKYLWPKVVVATNREYLDILEARYGAKCETHTGDIPSWWAEGPASSAKETGTNRLMHDRLVAAEALWTRAWLEDLSVEYPRKEINAAYDKMIHFDEHTWGASGSISDPHGENTVKQWQFKAAYGADAEKMTNDLYGRAIKQVSGRLAAPDAHSVAVWNTLNWPRSDVVEMRLAGTPLAGAQGTRVTDTRDQQAVFAQLSADGERLFFVARDVPALGCVVYSIKAAPRLPDEAAAKTGTLENGFYRLTASADATGLSSWYDKQLRRELLDSKAGHTLNQPIHEKVPAGREAVDNFTKRTEFVRTLPASGRLVSQHRGPVFQELTLETALPKCPRIVQTIRLYEKLKVVDLINVFTKEEETQPESIYVAFPFNVPQPDFRVQIADATMRPEKDQLTYSCRDFYSIQHWINVAGDRFGIAMAPIEGPLVLCSGLHVGKWADHLEFDNGHVYSWVMNNYWYTNFCAYQTGEIPFRYRLTSYPGRFDSVAATRFAWQPFYPLEAVWLKAQKGAPAPSSLITLGEKDTAVISCVKLAEAEEAIIVRLLEMSGKASKCTLRWNLPASAAMVRAYAADAVERPGAALLITGNSLSVSLRPNEIATIGLVPQRK